MPILVEFHSLEENIKLFQELNLDFIELNLDIPYCFPENIETNLINQDRRNQQSVRQFNAQQYNQYIDRKAAFDNGIREAKVTNINNLFSGINAGIQDMISRYENRKALNNTISAMRASAPNVDDRIMRDAGVDYDEFIIRKRRKLGGKQSCR